MLMMILLGAWCLIRGRLTLAKNFTLEGKRARSYGGFLITYVLGISPLIESHLVTLIPKSVVDGVAAQQVSAYGLYTLINFAYMAAVVYFFAFLFWRMGRGGGVK